MTLDCPWIECTSKAFNVFTVRKCLIEAGRVDWSTYGESKMGGGKGVKGDTQRQRDGIWVTLDHLSDFLIKKAVLLLEKLFRTVGS